jgi:hypothetical protein
MALTKTTVAMLEASGTPDSTSFLRGDGSWNSPPQSKQIQSITASVASNILTISTSSLTLDFRSTTSATGTATTITGTPASLAIPASQSFGIATSGVATRYAVLCVNNAGTLALAFSPLQGGVQLDETNLLSVTSTPTNTLTTIFSTITASSLAYRIIGFIDVAYTNGTGYATAPTLVQGIGGQALAAMSSIGYGQSWQTVTRTSGTTYYNTTGKPIFFTCYTAGSGTGTNIQANINGGGNFIIGYCNLPSGVAVTEGHTLIPAGASYVITVSSGAITVATELR